MKIKTRLRWLSGLLAVAILLQFIDPQLLHDSFRMLRTWAAASSYQAYFQWDISELMEPPENGVTVGDTVYKDEAKTVPARQITLTNGTALDVHEYADENVILKTTFYFNPKQSVDAGKLKFTIEGLDELIRNGTLTMDLGDPNLVKTWDYQKVDGKDQYVFVNTVPITSKTRRHSPGSSNPAPVSQIPILR